MKNILLALLIVGSLASTSQAINFTGVKGDIKIGDNSSFCKRYSDKLSHFLRMYIEEESKEHPDQSKLERYLKDISVRHAQLRRCLTITNAIPVTALVIGAGFAF